MVRRPVGILGCCLASPIFLCSVVRGERLEVSNRLHHLMTLTGIDFRVLNRCECRCFPLEFYPDVQATLVDDKGCLHGDSSSSRLWLEPICRGWSLRNPNRKFFILLSFTIVLSLDVLDCRIRWRVHWTILERLHHEFEYSQE